MSKTPQLAIWWLAPSDFEIIDRWDFPGWIPEYVRDEYVSARGRNGRGRLWVAKRFDSLIPNGGIDFRSPMGDHCAMCAGIVLEGAKVYTLMNVPGVVTDFALQRWGKP